MSDNGPDQPRYAGFWRRVDAFVVDYLLLLPVVIAIDAVFTMFAGLPLKELVKLELGFAKYSFGYYPTAFGAALQCLLPVIYFSAFESSRYQATPGKMMMGLVVTDDRHGRLSILRAVGRNAGKYLSFAISCIGFMMAGLTAHKQALHDLMAGTLVLRQPRDDVAGSRRGSASSTPLRPASS